MNNNTENVTGLTETSAIDKLLAAFPGATVELSPEEALISGIEADLIDEQMCVLAIWSEVMETLTEDLGSAIASSARGAEFGLKLTAVKSGKDLEFVTLATANHSWQEGFADAI